MPKRMCSVEGCDRKQLARGWCSLHYERWRTTGEVGLPGLMRIIGDDKERILSQLDQHGPIPEYAPELGPCWIWQRYRNDLGYGYASLGGRTRPAYQATYELFVGPVPEGLELDHLCRVPSCCNPTHLEAVTHVENLRRGVKAGFAAANAAKTHCPQGHPYDGDNLYIEPSTGRRRCRVCVGEAKLRFRERSRS